MYWANGCTRKIQRANLDGTEIEDFIKDEHAEHGSKIAESILEDLKYQNINHIVYAIKVHSFSVGVNAKTLEAQILSDADKLDAMGAVGVYRTAQYGKEHDRPISEFISHFHEKLLQLKDLVYTDEVKILAKQRYKFMQLYLDQIERELKCSC